MYQVYLPSQSANTRSKYEDRVAISCMYVKNFELYRIFWIKLDNLDYIG